MGVGVSYERGIPVNDELLAYRTRPDMQPGGAPGDTPPFLTSYPTTIGDIGTKRSMFEPG